MSLKFGLSLLHSNTQAAFVVVRISLNDRVVVAV